MFELSVAFKYLRPRWRQLSVSIISIISMLVIALVVWLIVVFFSVTSGLEKSWIQKLTALTAPVRVTPTSAYYQSYYYLIDSISSGSDYSLKSIHEKLHSRSADPYDADMDEEIPAAWPKADREEDGSLRDPVQKAFALIEGLKGVPGLVAHDFEMSFSAMRMRLVRGLSQNALTQSFLSQPAYIGSLDPHNTALPKAMLPISVDDLNNVLRMMAISSPDIQEDTPSGINRADQKTVQEKLKQFFSAVEVKSLQTPASGWALPMNFVLPDNKWHVLILFVKDRPSQLIIPLDSKELPGLLQFYEKIGKKAAIGILKTAERDRFIEWEGGSSPYRYMGPLLLPPNIRIPVVLNKDASERAISPSDVLFHMRLNVQNHLLAGNIPLENLEIGEAHVDVSHYSPLWFSKEKQKMGNVEHLILPIDRENGEAVILPKAFRDAGVQIADRGFLSYQAPTASSIQEQRAPVFVAGFYDPGIIPMGGKFILASAELTSMIRSSSHQDETPFSNGINIRFDDLQQSDQVKKTLEHLFQQAGIAPYWKIETFREYEFTKDLLQQLKSDRNLFTLIATVIIIVACSNIISMLIILVNDKKIEIGILRSMGASAFSVAAIFGICGIVMGLIGSVSGTLMAYFTLKNLDVLVGLLSKLYGYDAFNPVFYGDTLPNEMSFEALAFVILATASISLIAGLVPALKASLLRPSSILRSD